MTLEEGLMGPKVIEFDPFLGWSRYVPVDLVSRSGHLGSPQAHREESHLACRDCDAQTITQPSSLNFFD